MKKLKAKDLNERLHHMVHHRHEDGMGGWRESWERGESLWGAVQAVRGRDGFHADDVGGGFASGVGYVKNVAPARYRVIVRAPFDLNVGDRLEWQIGESRLTLEPTQRPYYVMDKAFVCFQTVRLEDE